MSQDTTGGREGNRTDAGTGRSTPEADAVRPGDRVVHTTDLGTSYEFRVVDVDDTWLTFENGQQVHRNRFEREDFTVVGTAGADAGSNGPATVEDRDATGPDDRPGAEPPAAADGGDAQPPNAD